MRRTWPLLMAALVALFFAQAQRAFFASLFGLAYDAVFPVFRTGPALLALLPFLALLAPLLPLARWLHRTGAVAIAAVGTAVFRLPMTHPALETRLVGGALVIACGAMFLTWAVGYLERRALAAGVVVGLSLDQLLRLAGSSYDLSLQPGWLPVQAVLSLGLVAVVVMWARAPRPGGSQDGLERRAGGLRLRGALALGALLFLDLHVVGLPPVVARWAGVGYGVAAVAVGVASGAAVAAALLLRRPTRGRIVTLLLTALVSLAPLIGYWREGMTVAVAMAAAHCAALLLVTRALDPASGRRSALTATVGFATLALATALYSLTFYAAFSVPALDGRVPWIFGGLGLLLAGCFVLIPRPADLTPPRSWLPAGVLSGGIVVAALVLANAGRVGAPAAVESTDGGTDEGGAAVRVVTWNVHYGFDEDWRFDPGAMAEALRSADPDVVALQEVLVGAPTAYGVDLPLWLGRQVGLRHHFAPTVNELLGDAFLTRLEVAGAEAVPLPPGRGDRKQLLRLTAEVGGVDVSFHALHLGIAATDRRAQMEAALPVIAPGPAVVLGDLNAEPGSPIDALLTDAGFRDVFHLAGTAAPTFPARRPLARIDWIRVRGLRVASAAVLAHIPSDHRAVVATLHIPDRRIRSTDANDLQAP